MHRLVLLTQIYFDISVLRSGKKNQRADSNRLSSCPTKSFVHILRLEPALSGQQAVAAELAVKFLRLIDAFMSRSSWNPQTSQQYILSPSEKDSFTLIVCISSTPACCKSNSTCLQVGSSSVLYARRIFTVLTSSVYFLLISATVENPVHIHQILFHLSTKHRRNAGLDFIICHEISKNWVICP